MALAEQLSLGTLQLLADASLRSICVALLVWLSLRFFRLRSAPMEHALWTIVLLAMPLLPVANRLLPALPIRIPVAVRTNPEPTTPPVRIHRAEPILFEVNNGNLTRVQPGAIRPARVWPVVLAALYMLGVLALAIRLFVGLLFARRLLAKSVTICNSEPNILLEQLAAEQRVPYPLPHLLESGQVAAPLLIGGNRASILLPDSWREWDRYTIRAALAHELTHVQRGDSLVRIAAALNTCIFWFHPLAWWIEKRLAILSEQASDDAAVHAIGDPARYAGVLLQMLAAAGPNRVKSNASALSMAGSGNTSRRIHRVLDTPHLSSGVLTKKFQVIFAATAVAVLVPLSAAQFGDSPKPVRPDAATGNARLGQWQSVGFSVTAQAAADLEQELSRNPDDLAARARLIAYYLYNVLLEPLHKHVMWVIEHHPESDLAGWGPVVSRHPVPATDRTHEDKKQLWLRQVAIHGGSARVLGNAALYMIQVDPVVAEDLLKRTIVLDPQETKWLLHLSNLYADVLRSGFFLQQGIPPFGRYAHLDTAFPTTVENVLAASDNAELIGSVGFQLAVGLAHSILQAPDRQSRIDAARTNMAAYAHSLLQRAQSMQPANARWAEGMAMLKRDASPRQSVQPVTTDPPESVASGGRIRVPTAVQAARQVQSHAPVYPPLAMQARIQGTVRLRVVIDRQGEVKSIQLLHGHPLLAPAATEAVMKWTYQPTVVNGREVEVETDLDVNFQLK